MSRRTNVTLFTIGFTGKSAQQFFELLMNAGVKRLIDTRINNTSQLSGFTKARDLPFFLKTITQIDYTHAHDFAPTKQLLVEYRAGHLTRPQYERRFQALLRERQPERHWTPADLGRACLLCSESAPAQCHRRLVAEYFQGRWPQIEIVQL